MCCVRHAGRLRNRGQQVEWEICPLSLATPESRATPQRAEFARLALGVGAQDSHSRTSLLPVSKTSQASRPR